MTTPIDKSTALSISVFATLAVVIFGAGIMFSKITEHTGLDYHIGVGEKFVMKEELKEVIEKLEDDFRYYEDRRSKEHDMLNAKLDKIECK